MKRRQRFATPLVVSFWLTAVLIFFLNNVGAQWASPLYQKVPPLDDLTVKDKEALELGRKVLAVKTALQDPCENASMKAIKDLGNDSRYYVLARGWIQQHLKMTESYRDTAKYRESAQEKKRVDQRIHCLKKMIRSLDLE